MALVKPDVGRFAKIKVLGIGGGGGNAINTMVSNNLITGVDFVAINTDAQALLANQAPVKLQIGEELTRGLGVGGNPELGAKSAEESREKITELLRGTDMVFITGGMGGGTATGASPVIAKIAKELGILTIAVVTKPFVFEGTRRMVAAEEGVTKLKENVDALIVIPNQKLLDSIDRKVTLVEAFKTVDSVLAQGVQGISDIITLPGLINRDFADIKSIMKDAGTAFMGIGVGTGENRAQLAARGAISSPLLEVSIDGARGILFTLTGGPDMTMAEVEEASKLITEHAGADANIIFGATISEKMIDQIKVSVIATGFDETRMTWQKMMNRPAAFPSQQLNKTPNASGSFDRSKLSEEETVSELPRDEMGEEFELPAFLRLGKQH